MVYRWLVFTNLFVSLCAASLVLATLIQARAAPSTWSHPMVGVVFGATLLVYTLDRLWPGAMEDHHAPSPRHLWIAAHRAHLVAFALGASALAFACALQLKPHIFWALAPLALITIAYSIPLIPSPDGFKRLKDLPGLKIFLIAVVWATVTVTLPLWQLDISPTSPSSVSLFIERACFIFAITLPFDIRDMQSDRDAGVTTLPHLLGISHTKRLAHAMLLIGLCAVVVREGIAPHATFWPALCASAASAWLIQRSGPQKPEQHYALFMEGTMLLWSACVVTHHALSWFLRGS